MSLLPENLSNDLLERVLSRLGFSRFPEPTFEGLQSLYSAWCRSVPFDNVRKLIHVRSQAPGPLPGDTPAEFFSAWLAFGTGATCWAGNGALHALLASLGFDTVRGVGTMLVAPGIPPNHGTALVNCNGKRYLVDASILHGIPLPLEESIPTHIDHPAWGVRCSKREGAWHIRWRPLQKTDGLDCLIDQIDVSQETFRARHESTRPWSPFNYELHVRRVRGDTVVGIARGQRVFFDAEGGISQTPLEGNERLRVLVEELGIDEGIARQLPSDIPTPPPP
jgi:N-hydroxyarylamine O-acetyltransferase